jgi:histidinol dehydrogenase
MILPVLKSSGPSFDAEFAALQRRRLAAQGLDPADAEAVQRSVEEIIAAVRKRGDEALLEFTARFDGCRLSASQLLVGDQEIEAAVRSLPRELIEALQLSAQRVRRFQEAILLREPAPIADGGRVLALRYRPVDSAGLCVPGASASLASSVLMTVVPASAAGVKRIVMITPPLRDGTVSPDRLAAARIAGAHEVYRVFGAQGVAALAFGTQTIPAVDFIAGPGNAYVTMAKKQVFGKVGIDMLAGPSEVAIIADRTARGDWVAAELLSQAEHHGAAATLLTDHEPLVEAVLRALEGQMAAMPDASAARANLQRAGAAIVTPALDACAELANHLAPEHLAIMMDEPDRV